MKNKALGFRVLVGTLLVLGLHLYTTPSLAARKAAMSCESLFALEDDAAITYTREMLLERKEREEALAILAEIEKLEHGIQAYRKFNGGLNRMAVTEKVRRLALFRSLVVTGQTDRAIDLYRQEFRDVERSVHTLLWAGPKIEGYHQDMLRGILDHEAGMELTEKVNAEVQAAYVQLGEDYGAYRPPLKMLETMIADTTQPQVAKNAEDILKYLGAHNIRMLLPTLALGEARPPIETIQHLFRTNPAALIAKLNADLKREKESRRMRISYSVMNKVFYIMERTMPRKAVQPVAKVLTGLSYDDYVYDSYMGIIEKIREGGPERRIESRFNDMIELSLTDDMDRFLETFARTVETRELWPKLKAYAEGKREGAEDAEDIPVNRWFFERMENAEKVAAKLKFLSINTRPSGAAKMDSTLQAGVVVSGSIYSVWSPEATQGLLLIKDAIQQALQRTF